MVGLANVENDNIHTNLYAAALPPGSICVFWKDLMVRTAANQGIYYQIDHYGANSQLSVEYILTAYDDSNDQQFYHVILVYDSDAVGLAELYYFSSGDGGANATIGAQGFDSMHVAQAVTYEYNTPNTVVPGNRINLVTDLNDDPNGTYSLRLFQVSCYPPGTWPVGVCTQG